MEEKMKLFNDQTGHLSEDGLRCLLGESLGELERLEAAEHLSFCDCCVERYTALLTDDVLQAPPEQLRHSVLRALRRRIARTMVNRYFTMGVAACLAMVFWMTGVFNMAATRPNYQELRRDRPPVSLGMKANDFAAGISRPISDFFSSIDLRGVFTNEKK